MKYRFHSRIGDVFYWDSCCCRVLIWFYPKTDYPSLRTFYSVFQMIPYRSQLIRVGLIQSQLTAIPNSRSPLSHKLTITTRCRDQALGSKIPVESLQTGPQVVTFHTTTTDTSLLNEKTHRIPSVHFRVEFYKCITLVHPLCFWFLRSSLGHIDQY